MVERMARESAHTKAFWMRLSALEPRLKVERNQATLFSRARKIVRNRTMLEPMLIFIPSLLAPSPEPELLCCVVTLPLSWVGLGVIMMKVEKMMTCSANRSV